MIRGALIAAVLALAACSKGPPTTAVAEGAPILPCECSVACRPSPQEPKLIADIPEGASDLVAARDREALKDAFRTERGNRASCSARLDVLFPKKDPKS